MDAFLTSRFQTLESVADIRTTFATPNHSQNFKPFNSKKPNPPDHKKLKSYRNSVSNDKNSQCSICFADHPLRLCPTFLGMSVEERYTIVKKQKRCTNCLGTSHEFKKCKSQYVCQICKHKHHSLLHRADNSLNTVPQMNPRISSQGATSAPNTNMNKVHDVTPPKVSNMNTTPSTSAEAAARMRQSYSTQIQSTSDSTVILGTALVDIYSHDLKYTVRALIDSASEGTFISRKLQNRLSLQTRQSQTEIHGLNDTLTATSTQICNIRIGSPIDSSFESHVEAFVVKRLTGQLPYYPLSALKHSEFADLRMADTHLHKCSEIDLLLGGDIYPKIIRNGLRWDNNQALVAQQTVFGWIVTGRIANRDCISSVLTFFNEIALNEQLYKFWQLEEVPREKRLSNDDIYCEELFKSTTYRATTGRFVVSLPFRREYPEAINIGSSRHIALSQFLKNESRLLKTPI